jgi:membrane protein DedA with SNARE-associated domain
VLFFVILVESFGILAPGQTLLITAALLAATGKLSIWLVLAIAFVAAVIGDNIGYFLGQQGGRRLILRYGRWIGLNRHRFRRLRRYFARYGDWFVLFARFFDVLRQLNGIFSGTVDMRFYRFALLNALGAALWVSLWGFGAYYLGRGLNQWVSRFDRIATWLVLVVLAAGVLLGLYALVRWLYFRYGRSEPRDNEP